MEQPRYVQHISKTGPIEDVLYDTGDDLWGYWIVKRTHPRGVSCEAMLWKQDYVLVEKPKAWANILYQVSADGSRLIYNHNTIARTEPGYRFVHHGELDLQRLT